MVDLIISLAEVLVITSFLFRDILYLRVITTLGLVAYAVAGLVAGYRSPGMTALIIFNVAGIIINVYQIYRIIQQRFSTTLPGDLSEVYHENFSMLSPQAFMKFYNLATVKSIPRHSYITTEGGVISELFLIKKGLVEVIVNEEPLVSLGPHYYLGEMGFLTNKQSTATIVAKEDVEVIAWEKSTLAKLEQNDASLYTTLYRSIAENLIKKIHLHRG